MPKLECYKYFFTLTHITCKTFSLAVIMITENTLKFLYTCHALQLYLQCQIINHYTLYFVIYISPLVLALNPGILLMFITMLYIKLSLVILMA